MKRTVLFSPEAQADLLALYDYITEQSDSTIALRYIGRIESYCLRFDISAERGAIRDDLRAGLRTVGFERRVTIAFHVEPRSVTIDRILYGGRDLDRIFHGEN